MATYECGFVTEGINLLIDTIARDPSDHALFLTLGPWLLFRGESELSMKVWSLAMSSTVKECKSNDLASSFLFDGNYCDDVEVMRCIGPVSIVVANRRLPSRGIPAPPPLLRNEWPLRIGYIGPNFKTHSVAYFLQAVMDNHDTQQYAIYCYSLSDPRKNDVTTQRLAERATAFRQVKGSREFIDTEEVARWIRNDKIQILVELAGHTEGGPCLNICALRPAPIQVTWLGYPNTTGLETIDYRITDALADPVDTTQIFSEELIRLPECFICYCPTPEAMAMNVNEAPCVRNDYVTFGSCNQRSKISKTTIKMWSRVLHAVPGSRMLVKHKHHEQIDLPQHMKFLKMMGDEGIGPDRLIITQKVQELEDRKSVV